MAVEIRCDIPNNDLRICTKRIVHLMGGSCTYEEIYKSDKHYTINYRGHSYKSIVDRIRVHYYNYLNDNFIKL